MTVAPSTPRDADRLARGVAAGVLVALASIGAGVSAWSGRTAPTILATGDAPAVSPTIDLNTATPAQLEALPMIGPKRAEAIVADRARRGPFRSVEDLDRVHGIGPRTVERLRPFVTATPGD